MVVRPACARMRTVRGRGHNMFGKHFRSAACFMTALRGMETDGGSRAKAGKHRAGDGAGALGRTVAKHEKLLQPLHE